MAYRRCSQCNAITDEDEAKCPACASSHFADKIITSEELVSKIIKKEISPSKVWTKRPKEIGQTTKSLSP